MQAPANFKALRTRTGLTLRQVEKETGLSNAYLSQLENGKIKKPSFDTVTKLLTFYERHKKPGACPCCYSANIKDEKVSQDNGVFGPGSATWNLIEYKVCQDCGVMFKEVK